jgi:hypothetical protein
MWNDWIIIALSGASGVLIIAFALIVNKGLLKKDKMMADASVVHDWVATGRIDFYQIRNYYVLQAEDFREVTSVGGLQHKEIRWRVANLDEAKKVVVKFHQTGDA